jgi:hypothetical protein
MRASIIPEEPMIYLVEDQPDEVQQNSINLYAAVYETQFGFPPFGLHYIKLHSGDSSVTCVWLPTSSDREASAI